jgi:hypothetical protein
MGSSPFGAVIPVTGLNIGFVGEVSRTADPPVIAAREASPANLLNILFGDPVVLLGDATGGLWQSVADFIIGAGTPAAPTGGAFTAALFAGIAVREVKTQLGYPITPGNASIGYYRPGEMTEALERGSICVKFNVATGAIAGGPVYIRILLNGAIPAGLIGGFESQADGANTVLLTNTVFRTGVVDGNGVAEITVLNRVAA